MDEQTPLDISIMEVIKSLRDGEGIQIDKDPVTFNLKITWVSEEHLKALALDTSKASVAVWMQRPGARLFTSYAEYEFFPPDVKSGPNPPEEYEYRMFKWEGLIYGISTVPYHKKELLFIAAKEASLRLLPGVQMMANAKGWLTFPLHNPDQKEGEENVFNAENLSGSMMYSNEPGGMQDLLTEEDYKINQLHERFYEKYGHENPDV